MALIEKIRKEIPEKFIVESNTPETNPLNRINSVHTFRSLVKGRERWIDIKVVFLVKIYGETEAVTISTDGGVGMGVTTSQFLLGVLPGFERERSFWETI